MHLTIGFLLFIGMLCTHTQALAQPPIIPVGDIKPGMKGYGLTVFSGVEPEKFQVEVVSVVPNFLLRQNIILIRCSHPVTDKAGVIGGMSGSPIYIEGKLAGALAYGWRFNKEPLAGVTPIQNMYDVLDRKLRGRKIHTPLDTIAQLLNPLHRKPPATPTTFFNHFAEHGHSQLLPAQTPLSISGFSGNARQILEDTFRHYGIDPMQGGGSGQISGDPKAFVPGGPIGVQLVRGDMSATGIGTVTTIKDGNVLAFGHPMMNMGEGYLPVTTAQIHTVIASLARSNKLGSPLSEIGSLIQDRKACIVARTDVQASMIPVEFTIEDKRSNIHRTYKVEVASHRLLSARLIHAALIEIIQDAVSDTADVTAEISGELKVSGRPSIVLNDSGVSRSGLLPLVSYFRPSNIVAAILANPFEDVAIEWLKFQVTLHYGLDFARVAGAFLTAQNPAPGDVVSLNVRLLTYGNQEQILTLPIRIPLGTENTKIQLTVGGGDAVSPPIPTPENLDHMLANVQRFHPPKSMVVQVSVPNQSLMVRGHTLDNLPSFAISALKPTMGQDTVQSYKTYETSVHPTENIIAGKHTIHITVGDRRNK